MIVIPLPLLALSFRVFFIQQPIANTTEVGNITYRKILVNHTTNAKYLISRPRWHATSGSVSQPHGALAYQQPEPLGLKLSVAANMIA
mmetsp:Transcript_28423/g.51907  ORF Transcript_28423/g.51907 Transcript_28423/m.51907 type:complete len:88 (+) Transcript_28423:1017-1280(+)